MKKTLIAIIGSLLLLSLLTSCNKAVSKKIVGKWKCDVDRSRAVTETRHPGLKNAIIAAFANGLWESKRKETLEITDTQWIVQSDATGKGVVESYVLKEDGEGFCVVNLKNEDLRVDWDEESKGFYFTRKVSTYDVTFYFTPMPAE